MAIGRLRPLRSATGRTHSFHIMSAVSLVSFVFQMTAMNVFLLPMTGSAEEPIAPPEETSTHGEAPAPISPLLSIEKSADPSTPTEYTLSYENTGDVPAYNVVVTDRLPDILTFVSASDGYSYDAGMHSVSWTFSTLGAHESGSVNVSTSFPYGTVGQCVMIQNSASIQGVAPYASPLDPAPLPGLYDETTLSQSLCPRNPDLQIEKHIVEKGETAESIQYRIDYANTGNWTAYNVVIQDVFPTGTSFVEASSAPDSQDDSSATWKIANLPAGESGSITITLAVHSDESSCSQLTNSVSIAQNLDLPVEEGVEYYPELNVTNNSASAQSEHFYGNCNGTVSGAKWNDINNNGIWDEGEAGLPNWTIKLYTSCSQTIGDYDYDSNGVIDLGDFVRWTQLHLLFDPGADLNGDSVHSLLDLECLKVPFNNGGTLTGLPTLIDTTLTDTNGNYSFENLGPGMYSIGEAMQTNWSQSFPGGNQLHGPVSLNEGGTLSNYNFGNHFTDETGAGGDGDPDGGDTIPPHDPVVTSPVLSIDKTVEQSTANPGQVINYSILVKNTGDGAAEHVVLSDTLPLGLVFTDTNTQFRTWDLGASLAAGASVTTSYKVTVSPTAAGGYTNTASVSAGNYQTMTDTATVSVSTPIVAGDSIATTTLGLTKVADVDRVNPAGTVSYTISVKNTGATEAMNVVVSDTLPVGMQYLDTGSLSRSWDVGNLLPGASSTLVYDVTIDGNAPASMLSNTAKAEADNADPVSAAFTLEVIRGSVLGAEVLADTGVGRNEYAVFALGAMLIGLGVIGFRRSAKLTA